MTIMKIPNPFFSYEEYWEKTELYCPRCGKQEIWLRIDNGDFYIGNQHICIVCKSTFYLPKGIRDILEEHDEKRLMHLIA